VLHSWPFSGHPDSMSSTFLAFVPKMSSGKVTLYSSFEGTVTHDADQAAK
jgi:hypothetical protein